MVEPQKKYVLMLQLLLDEKTNSCKEEIKNDRGKEEEVIKIDGGKNNKFSFILLIIPLIFLY